MPPTKDLLAQPQIRDFVRTFSQAVLDGNAAIFAGAGLSQPAGYVNWKELLRTAAEDLNLDIDRETDLISLAQYHCNERGSRSKINQLIIEEFAAGASPTDNHKVLAQLPIDTFWTTNYDHLIEDCLVAAKKKPDVKWEQAQLAQSLPRRDAQVFKMHGDARHPSTAVITKDDYEAYTTTRQLFSTKLQGDLVSKTFAFLGFSFDDPNLGYILSRIRVLLGENRREHYCFFKSISEKDFKNNEEFLYAKIKQELRINDLKRYSIKGVLVEEYDDITAILREIHSKIRTRRVFLSGSAHEYGRFSETEAQSFIHDLSRALASDGFEIVSGFGLGVGSFVINGALEHIFSSTFGDITNRLTLRPFPQHQSGTMSLKDLWTRYRAEIANISGVAIFMFGNKLNKEQNNVVSAGGMIEEFNIAVAQGVKVIPIGATGYVSSELASIVIENANSHYPGDHRMLEILHALNSDQTSLDGLRTLTLEAVRRIAGGKNG